MLPCTGGENEEFCRASRHESNRTPKTEWPVIAVEPASIGTLIAGYAVPLAAIGAIAAPRPRTSRVA